MKLSITPDEFNTHKETIKADIAALLNTIVSKIQIALKSSSRRRLNNEVDIEVTVDADSDEAATSIENTVTGDSFAGDLGTRISESTELEVTVSSVSEPVTATVTTTEDSSDDSSN